VGAHHQVINQGIALDQVAQFTHHSVPRADIQGVTPGTYSHNGHTVLLNHSIPNTALAAPVTGRPSPGDVQAYGTVGAIQRNYVPHNSPVPGTGTPAHGQPMVVQGNYTPTTAPAAGWSPAPQSHNVTVIGKSFAPPHGASPYVTYTTGQPAPQTPKSAPVVPNPASQSAWRTAAPTQVQTPSPAPTVNWSSGVSPHNVTTVGQSFAPPHVVNPYVAYNNGRTMNQSPSASAPAWQTPRNTSPQPQYIAPSYGAPHEHYENNFSSYSAPVSHQSSSQYSSSSSGHSSQSSSSSGNSSGGSSGNGHTH
jgi:hypothetical protein